MPRACFHGRLVPLSCFPVRATPCRTTTAAAAAGVAGRPYGFYGCVGQQIHQQRFAFLLPTQRSLLHYQKQQDQHHQQQQQQRVCLRNSIPRLAIRPAGCNNSSSSGNSSSSSSSSNSSNSSKVPPPQDTMKKHGDHHSSHSPKPPPPHGILNFTKWGLSEWSNFAAVLCALDCTLLPILTAAIPFAGLVADAQHLHAVHVASRWVAMYIVLPLGGFAVISNFLQLRRKHLLLMGLAGLVLVFTAHASTGCHENHHVDQQQQQVDPDPHKHHSHHPAGAPTVPSPDASKQQQQQQQQEQQQQPPLEQEEWKQALAQAAEVHHTIISLCGAVLLLSSNFLSHRMKHKLGGHHHHAHCCSSASSSSRSKEKQALELCSDDSDAEDHGDRVSLLRDN
ncbi:hypothetical protein Esti_001652 [Eimeria stiedai]